MSSSSPLLTVEDLFVSFTRGGNTVQAVAGVSFTLQEGETLGLVGESGCGKTTTGRAIVQVEKPTSGKVTFQGTELTSLDRGDLRKMRTEMQMIFQDPISSLNPRRRVADIVAEPLTIWQIGTKEERRAKVNAMLDSVGIDPDVAGNRYPREFSGGQCQRISIARGSSSNRSSWCVTRSSRPSMSPSRRRSSICSRISRPAQPDTPLHRP